MGLAYEGKRQGREGLVRQRNRRMSGHKHRQQREKGNARGRIKELKTGD